VADDDWRVTVTLHNQQDSGRAVDSLREHQVEADVRRQLGQHVTVSADGPTIFLYAGAEDAARQAERVVREVMAQHQLEAGYELHRWHPVEEEWEDASVALPQTAEQQQQEHRRLEDEETREALATGHAQWQVRVELASHRDAVQLARRLLSEGHPVTRRWRFLVIGANNEDDASDLARTVRQEAPANASVRTEPASVGLPFIPF